MEVRYEFGHWFVYVDDTIVFEHEDRHVAEEWMDYYEVVTTLATTGAP